MCVLLICDSFATALPRRHGRLTAQANTQDPVIQPAAHWRFAGAVDALRAWPRPLT
jgi:hypothetical protein